jgi:hypothetical protein
LRQTFARLAATSCVVVTAAFLGFTAAASAATANQKADKQAIAIATKMAKAEKAHLSSAKKTGTTYTKSIKTACGGVLEPVVNELSTKTSLKVALEMLGDVLVKGNIFDIKVAKADATKIAKLHWTGGSATEAKDFKDYIVAIGKLGTSNLCKDAKALAADPSKVPAGTTAYAKKVQALEKRASAYSGFPGLLSGNATGADKKALGTATKALSSFALSADKIDKSILTALYNSLAD